MKVILFAIFYYEQYGGEIFQKWHHKNVQRFHQKKNYFREKIGFYFWRMFNKQSLLSKFPEFFPYVLILVCQRKTYL